MTYNDFVMECAIVETTNETIASDIQMEQWNAEFNVACAAFDAFNKYSLIAEYATCDLEEYVQESKYGPDATTRLTGAISKVDDWKNSGGKMKKVLGTIAESVLKFVRMIARGLKKLFGGAKTPITKLSAWAASKKAEARNKKPEKYQAKEDKKNAKIAAKQMNDPAYLAEGEKKRADAYAGRVSELEKQNAKLTKQVLALKNQWKKKNAEIEKMNEILKKMTNDMAHAKQYISDYQKHSAKLSTELKDARNDRDEAATQLYQLQQILDSVAEGKKGMDEISAETWDAIQKQLDDANSTMKTVADNSEKSTSLLQDVYDNLDKAPTEVQVEVKFVLEKEMNIMKKTKEMADACGFKVNASGQLDF